MIGVKKKFIFSIFCPCGQWTRFQSYCISVDSVICKWLLSAPSVKNSCFHFACTLSYIGKLGSSICNPYTPCWRYTASLLQGGKWIKMDWHNVLLCFKVIHPLRNNYRLITAYLLLRVNCDKIMHACWDFDVSNTQTQRGVGQASKLKWKCIILSQFSSTK